MAASVCGGRGPSPDRGTPHPLRRWTSHQPRLDGPPSHSTPQGVSLPKTLDKVVASDQAFSEGVPGAAALGPPARTPDRTRLRFSRAATASTSHGPAPGDAARAPRPRPRCSKAPKARDGATPDRAERSREAAAFALARLPVRRRSAEQPARLLGSLGRGRASGSGRRGRSRRSSGGGRPAGAVDRCRPPGAAAAAGP